MPNGVHLSRLKNLMVVSADHQLLGRVVDISALLSPGNPKVHRLVVGSGRQPRFVVPWSLVASLDDLNVRLRARVDDLDQHRVASGTSLGEVAMEPGEVMLVRDVLDSQVVDLGGMRLARVSDVLLVGSAGALSVVGADLGVGALLRRMGFARLGARMRPLLVAWTDLHLASPRGHTVQLAVSTSGIRSLDPPSLAEALSRLATDPATDVLRAVGPARAADALGAGSDTHRRRLVGALPSEDAEQVIGSAPGPVGRALRKARDESKMQKRRFRRTAGWRGHRRRHGQAPAVQASEADR